MAARLEHHGSTGGDQSIHQVVDVLLEQRLAARDFDERTSILLDRAEHGVDRHLPPFRERVRRVTPRAAEVACGQADEDAGLSGARRLALNRVEDLVDGEHPAIILTRKLEMAGDVRIGTSGWNYPTGRGTWNGIFYP